MGYKVTGLDDEPDHATPLSPEERDGLIPSHLTLRSELNELEEENILAAAIWAFQRRRDAVQESFGRNLHKRMFGTVWRWAGVYRTTNKNLGVEYGLIHARLGETFERIRYWAEHEIFPPDEIAVRFHHELVAIHPFPNGNGRWSRLMADLLVVRLGQARFTWGRSSLRTGNEVRRSYITALKAADNHDLALLIAFARS
jgi:Fic-DOC domain mobile mystery protein B